MARTGIAALCLLLVAFVDLGSCTRCYLCTSTMDKQCGDPFAYSKTPQDCNMIQGVSDFNRGYLSVLGEKVTTLTPNSPRHCHKIVLQGGVVVRTCLDVNPISPNATCNALAENARLNPGNQNIQLRYCSVCEGDNCNGASAQMASISLALAALVSAYFSYKQ